MHLRHLNSVAKQYQYEIVIHECGNLSSLLAPPASAQLPQPPFRVSDPFVLSVDSRSKHNQTKVAVISLPPSAASSSSSPRAASPSAALSSALIVFDEALSFTSTLFFHPSKSRFDSKKFSFCLTSLRLKGEKRKSAFTSLSAPLDLASHASPHGDDTDHEVSLLLEPEKAAGVSGVQSVELRLTIRSRYVGEGVANEVSLLSVMSRGSRSASSSRIRALGAGEDSRLRRWREKGEEREEEEEVAMRRKEREEEGSSYKVTLDIIGDEDEEEKASARDRLRQAEESRQREDEEQERKRQEEERLNKRKERRRTFNAEDLFQPAAAAPEPAKAEKRRAGLDTVLAEAVTEEEADSNGVEQETKESRRHRPALQHTDSASSIASTSSVSASNSSSSSRVPAPAPSPLSSPTRVNIHLPPTVSSSSAALVHEHELRYRARMEPRLALLLSLLLPSAVYSSSAFHTTVSSLSTLPSSPCVFFSAFTTLRQEKEREAQLLQEARARAEREQEQHQWLAMTEKQRKAWKQQRERERMDVEKLRREEERRRHEAEAQEAEERSRAAEERSMRGDCAQVVQRWYFHSYPSSAILLWRCCCLCHMFHADVEDREEEITEDGAAEDDDGAEEADEGRRRGGKQGKRKMKVRRRHQYRTVQVTTARRGWMLELLLRALRRRVEESRDNYGELLWLVNALVMLRRCASRRRRKEEEPTAADSDPAGADDPMRAPVKDFGIAMPVNGKAGSRSSTGGQQTPAADDPASSFSCFVPHYPFVSPASSSPSFPLFDYGRSPLSSTLTPLGFFVHQVGCLLRSSLCLLLHHLSFALSYRLPLSSILSPSSLSLETVLDLLLDIHQLLTDNAVRPELRQSVIDWCLRVVSARIVNAVMSEVQRCSDGSRADDDDEHELPLASPIMHRVASLPSPAASSVLPSSTSSPTPPALPQLPLSSTLPVISCSPPASSPAAPLLDSTSSFLTLGMRLMMIANALRDFLSRCGYLQQPDVIAPLQSLALFCLTEKEGARKEKDWRRECSGLSDAQVAALCSLYERVGGARIGEAVRKRAQAGRAALWVEWPGEVELQLGFSVVPFAAASVGLPAALKAADASKLPDGLLEADSLIIQ